MGKGFGVRGFGDARQSMVVWIAVEVVGPGQGNNKFVEGIITVHKHNVGQVDTVGRLGRLAWVPRGG